MRVAKRLNPRAFEKLNDVLWQFLTLSPGLRPFMQEWENDLRKEISSAQ